MMIELENLGLLIAIVFWSYLVRIIIKDNLLKLIKAAPLRSLLGFFLLLPYIFLSLALIVFFGGWFVEFALKTYGPSRLGGSGEGKLYVTLSMYFMDAFAFFVPFGMRKLLMILYGLGAAYFLVSAHKEAKKKRKEQGENRN